LALSKLDLRVIELLEELKGSAESFEEAGDPLDGNQPCIPALYLLARVYPETPDSNSGPDENGVYHFDRYTELLFACTDYVAETLADSCEMWIKHLKARAEL